MNVYSNARAVPSVSDHHGYGDLERLLCAPVAAGSIEALLPRNPDAWAIEFPRVSSLGTGGEVFTPLRVCIATEDIVGPVRNGGIGTTYAALAELLAAEGHDTTILYLRGQEVETESIDHWVAYYAQRGVRFVPVPNYAVRDNFRSEADRWLRAPYNMMRYLLEHPMDVVHVSEWRGSGYLSLLAKRQGIAFAETLFVVKTSSPWMWNRLYGSQALDRTDDIVKVHAERQSVELADIVVGGSLHLLRWMASQGYNIPADRTFVQPNVASFDKLEPLLKLRAPAPATRMPIDEVVFFGRLEARKGLFVFCQAIRRLIRQGVPLPPKISFMGKPGAKLSARPDKSPLDFIREITADWPCTIEILTEFQQYEAIEYLLSGARLAVMPSIIENSSMAIYEAAICGIPCVASNVGGNAELIHPDDRDEVLCFPHPISLAGRIEEALKDGGYVARPSFDNGRNLDEWRGFHRALGSGLRTELLGRARVRRPEAVPPSVSVCVFHTGREDSLKHTLASLRTQEAPPIEVLVAVDAEDGAALARAGEIMIAAGFPARVTDAYDLDAGAGFNLLSDQAGGEHLLFLWEGATIEPQALSALASMARSSGAEVLNYFHRIESDQGPRSVRATILGSSTESFFRSDIAEMPLFVRRDTFRRLEGFTTDYRVLCHEYEFVSKAQLAGVPCETAMLELGTVEAWDAGWLRQRGYDLQASNFRAIRPKLAATPLSIRDLLLFTKGMQLRGGPAARGPSKQPPNKKPDSLLARMMSNMSPGEAGRPNPRKVRPPAAKSGLLSLLDRYEEEDEDAKPERAAAGPSAQLADLIERGQLARDEDILARILGIHGGELHGWAIRGEGGAPVELELEIDGRVTALTAGGRFASFSVVPPEARRRGFAVRLPSRRRGGSTESTYRLRRPGSSVILAEGPLPPASQRLWDHGIEGYCDASDNGVVYGWVWRPTDPHRKLNVSMFIDGTFFACMQADRDRDDLRHRGVGDGEYGFNITLPRAVREAGTHRIDVVVSESGLPLVRSPLQSTGLIIGTSRAAPKRGWKLW